MLQFKTHSTSGLVGWLPAKKPVHVHKYLKQHHLPMDVEQMIFISPIASTPSKQLSLCNILMEQAPEMLTARGKPAKVGQNENAHSHALCPLAWREDGPAWREDSPGLGGKMVQPGREGPAWREDGPSWRESPAWQKDGTAWREDGPAWREDGPSLGGKTVQPGREGPAWREGSA